MALWWLCSPESMPSICLVYGLALASGGFEMNSPQHPKWNQPRKGARDAARHSRNRTGKDAFHRVPRMACGKKWDAVERVLTRLLRSPRAGWDIAVQRGKEFLR